MSPRALIAAGLILTLSSPLRATASEVVTVAENLPPAAGTQDADAAPVVSEDAVPAVDETLSADDRAARRAEKRAEKRAERKERKAEKKEQIAAKKAAKKREMQERKAEKRKAKGKAKRKPKAEDGRRREGRGEARREGGRRGAERRDGAGRGQRNRDARGERPGRRQGGQLDGSVGFERTIRTRIRRRPPMDRAPRFERDRGNDFGPRRGRRRR